MCIDAGLAGNGFQLMEYQRVDKVVADQRLPFVNSDVTCGSLKHLTLAGLAKEQAPDDSHVSTVIWAQLEYGVVFGIKFRIITDTPPGF